MKEMGNNIWHVYPVNDVEEHFQITEKGNKIIVSGEVRTEITCRCKCNPTIKYLENDGVIVKHHSWDGREGVEWFNEIVNK